MKTLNMAALKAIKNGEGPNAPAPESTFTADTLALTVTAPDGTVVYEAELQPKAFKPKEKANGRVEGSVGWYAAAPIGPDGKRSKILGKYKGFDVSGNNMLFLDGIKVPPGTPVDLSDDEE